MPRLVALAVCAVGAASIVAALYLSSVGRRTRTFTRVPGRVVASYVEEIPAPAEEGGPKFRPVVRYAYEARGRAWAAERISYGAPPQADTTDRAEAQRRVERYPVGAAVEVWIDPADPASAVLVRGVSSVPVAIGIVVGLALLGVGIFALARA